MLGCEIGRVERNHSECGKVHEVLSECVLFDMDKAASKTNKALDWEIGKGSSGEDQGQSWQSLLSFEREPVQNAITPVSSSQIWSA